MPGRYWSPIPEYKERDQDPRLITSREYLMLKSLSVRTSEIHPPLIRASKGKYYGARRRVAPGVGKVPCFRDACVESMTIDPSLGSFWVKPGQGSTVKDLLIASNEDYLISEFQDLFNRKTSLLLTGKTITSLDEARISSAIVEAMNQNVVDP